MQQQQKRKLLHPIPHKKTLYCLHKFEDKMGFAPGSRPGSLNASSMSLQSACSDYSSCSFCAFHLQESIQSIEILRKEGARNGHARIIEKDDQFDYFEQDCLHPTKKIKVNKSLNSGNQITQNQY